ncbi:MAG: site-specific integrase [Phycisphaeraceae bacterium]|nr:site-specific integrase [Phycisphaeraceae bacterium]
MASLNQDKSGKYRIQFADENRKRKTIYLGHLAKRDAEMIKWRVEELIRARLMEDRPNDEVARWCSRLEGKWRKKLEGVDLIPKRENATLEEFITAYINGRNDIKPSTRDRLLRTQRELIGCFGGRRNIRSFSEEDGRKFEAWMIKEGRANNTLRRYIGTARQYFEAAIRRGLYEGFNPFKSVTAAMRRVASRDYFVSREEIQAVLEACPDAEWRVIFALTRFGGVRCPSEIMPLKWSDIYWDRNRVRITSPKTEHHEGGGERMIPLWPELREALLELFEQVEEGVEHVITRYRDTRTNLRTQAHRIIRRAGLVPWPKIFHNLRSSRQTELSMTHPIHQVCAWIGNSKAVAMNHYLQVRDEDINEAVSKAAEERTQKATRQPRATVGNEKQRNGPPAETRNSQSSKIAALIAKFRDISDPDKTQKAPRAGLEPAT